MAAMTTAPGIVDRDEIHVLSPVPRIYASSMSSDPIADLGRTLEQFAGDLAALFVANDQPRPGTPAGREAAGEPFGGDWGAQPARELIATIALASASCADYLTVIAKTLQARSGMYSLYTLARSALEAAAQGCYLSQPDIKPLERIRRHMNLDLRALHEDGRMLRRIADRPSVAKANKHADRELVIGRAGEQFGLSFTKATDRRQAYLGDEPVSAMKMIEECAPNEPALKSAYQLLSGVAHGLWHGHARLLQRSQNDIPGTVGLGLAVSAQALARDLAAAPLCACALVGRLGWYTGWDLDAVMTSMNYLSANWERVARMG